LLQDDGSFICLTLEPPQPMPAGGPYAMYRYRSPHFGYDVFRTDAVPGHTAIEIHRGNWAHDSRDCVLVGSAFEIGPDMVTGKDEKILTGSRVTFTAFSIRAQGASEPERW
jgi:hypothetical protein